MLVIILSVFAMCWLPFQISILYSEHRSDKNQPVSENRDSSILFSKNLVDL